MSGHASKIGNDVSQTQAPTVTRLSHTWAWNWESVVGAIHSYMWTFQYWK